MADAISQLYSRSSNREIKVNDQNKASVETEIVHTNTAQIQLRRNLKWFRTSQRQ